MISRMAVGWKLGWVMGAAKATLSELARLADTMTQSTSGKSRPTFYTPLEVQTHKSSKCDYTGSYAATVGKSGWKNIVKLLGVNVKAVVTVF
jgi:hypothetical protein